jgi:hypothetical protein
MVCMAGIYKRDKRENKERRKATWEIRLNPVVTFLIVVFCFGILLVWIGLFEHRVNPFDGVLSTHISRFFNTVKDYIDQFI